VALAIEFLGKRGRPLAPPLFDFRRIRAILLASQLPLHQRVLISFLSNTSSLFHLTSPHHISHLAHHALLRHRHKGRKHHQTARRSVISLPSSSRAWRGNIQTILKLNALTSIATVDGTIKSNSGHPGAPMGMAPVAHVLFNKFMTFNPKNPDWLNRDRFVLSYVSQKELEC
jgi:hypothetical protein